MKNFSLDTNWISNQIREFAYCLHNDETNIFEGNGHFIDGKKQTVHLMKIDNCRDLKVRDVIFRNGNTGIIKNIPRNQISFPQKKTSIFEIIDGGAVVITGRSNVTFENCQFIGNKSIMCGGAISNQGTGIVKIRNCLFENNIAGHTGAAVDNLTKHANVEVVDSRFIDNISNQWLRTGAPHGQISVFPNTKASIINCSFHKGSVPFDYYQDSTIQFKDNTYTGFDHWSESLSKRQAITLLDLMNIFKNLYWIAPKTIGKVYYRVNP